MPRRVATSVVDEVPPALIQDVVARVRAARALPIAKLTRQKLSRRALATLNEALAREGLETTGRQVRVPLETQIAAVLAEVDTIPLSDLKKRLAGAGALGEVRAAVSGLVRRGAARLVVRRGKEHVTQHLGRTMDSEAGGSLERFSLELAKLTKAARPQRGGTRRSLWLDDVEELVRALPDAVRSVFIRAGARDSMAPESARPGRDATAALLVDALQRASAPLVFIPELAATLSARVSPEELRRALLDASAAGDVELRPESGVGLLTPEQSALCPRGPTGAVLSYARVKTAGGDPA